MEQLQIEKEMNDLRREKDLFELAYSNIRSIKWGRKEWVWGYYPYEHDLFAESVFQFIIDSGITS